MDLHVLSSFSVPYSQPSSKETAYSYELFCCILSTALCATIIQCQPQDVYSLCYSWQQSEKALIPLIPTFTGRIVLKIGNQVTFHSFFSNPGAERTFKQRCRAVSLREAGVIFSSRVLAMAVKHEHSWELWAERLCMGSYLQKFKQAYCTYKVQKQSCCL